MDYFIADLHLGHKNIIDICHRPFESVDEMDEQILANIEKTVKPEDSLWVLGDVSMHYNRTKMENALSRIKCYKALIMGNHDGHRSSLWWQTMGFNDVFEYPIIYKDKFILSHEPMFMSRDMPYINLHGHTHDTSQDNPRNINCSVEVIAYTPISMNVIKTVILTKGLE